MDIGLRIIANPYLLKTNRIINSRDQESNDLLYDYLNKKYKKIFISPDLFYKVIEGIDEIVLNYEVEQVIAEIIEGVFNKFDIMHAENL